MHRIISKVLSDQAPLYYVIPGEEVALYDKLHS